MASFPYTSIALNQARTGYEGGLVEDYPHVIETDLKATEAIRFGLAVERAVGVAATIDRVSIVPDIQAADADAFVTAHATAAAETNLEEADFNGVLGTGIQWPSVQPGLFTMTNHADFDDTELVVDYVDLDGNLVQIARRIPDGGNGTLTLPPIHRLRHVLVRTQAGAGGSYQIGYTNAVGILHAGIALRDLTKTQPSTAIGYAQYDAVKILRKGIAWVLAEAAVTRDRPVFVRQTAAGAEVRGAFRGDSDAGDAAVLHRARWVTSTTGAGLAAVELY